FAGLSFVAPPGARAPQRPNAPPAGRIGAVDLEREHRAGRIVLRFAPGSSESDLAALAKLVGARSQKTIWPGLLARLDLPPEADLRAALALLAADPRVAYAQPSWIYHALGVPDDTDFNLQWNMDQANDADIDAPEAWDTATDASAAIVA